MLCSDYTLIYPGYLGEPGTPTKGEPHAGNIMPPPAKRKEADEADEADEAGPMGVSNLSHLIQFHFSRLS